MLVNSIDSATGANQSAVVTTLMMTERRVNVLHYATSLSGVTHASEFRQMDLSLHHSFIWIQVNNSLSNLKENNDQTRDSEHSRGPFILPGKKKKGLKFNLEISTAKRNLYWANERTLSFGVWSQQGEERCPTLIGGSIANKTIQLQCTDWPFVSIVQIIPPTFILINFNWTACVLGSSCNSGQCSEDAEADLINLT